MELLVVIAIIAVLAAAGFAGGTAAMNRARKLSAQATATSLVTAIDQFYTEYSSLPDVSSTVETDQGQGIELLKILAGQEEGNSPENDRKIRFLSVKEGKGTTATTYYDGAFYASNKIAGLRDPWKQPYHVVMDNEAGNQGYDERITVSPGNSIPSVTLNGRRAAVYSLGVRIPAEAKTTTLVKTW